MLFLTFMVAGFVRLVLVGALQQLITCCLWVCSTCKGKKINLGVHWKVVEYKNCKGSVARTLVCSSLYSLSLVVLLCLFPLTGYNV